MTHINIEELAEKAGFVVEHGMGELYITGRGQMDTNIGSMLVEFAKLVAEQVRSNDLLGVTADGIAYRIARELCPIPGVVRQTTDLIGLAGDTMRYANADGHDFDVEAELASPRLALAAYEAFSRNTRNQQ